MPDVHSENNDEKRSRERSPQQSASSEHMLGAQNGHQEIAPLARSLLGADSLASRSNSIVRASTIQQMQSTHGNRAVQRYVHRNTSQRPHLMTTHIQGPTRRLL